MNSAAPHTAIEWRELESLLGAEALLPQACAVRPATAEHTAALVRWAGERRQRLAPVAGMDTNVSFSGLRVDLSRLRAVRFHEPQDLTAGFEAGIRLPAIAAKLAASGQFLPLDLPRAAERNLGATLASQASGPLRQYYGTVRDFTIGIEFVSGRGEIVHAGGRVVKNVAGFDLMKLMIGSRGSLGFILAANFRLHSLPARTASWTAPLRDLEQAERLRRAMQACYLRPLAWELANCLPAEAAATIAPSQTAQSELWAVARFSGGEAVLERCRNDLQNIAAAAGATAYPVAAADETEFWEAWNNWPNNAPGAWLRLSAPQAVGTAALAVCREELAQPGEEMNFQGRLGLGIFRLHLTSNPSTAALAACRRRLRGLSGPSWDGAGADLHLAWPAAPTAVDRWGELSQDRELMRRIKIELDPFQIFPDPFGLHDA